MSSESGNYAARCGDILESSDDSDDEILSQYEPQPPKVSYESDQTQKTSPLKTAAEESAVTQSQGTKKRKRQSHFYGVYLLRSKAPQHPNSTYIGFTVNPQRRIRQVLPYVWLHGSSGSLILWLLVPDAHFVKFAAQRGGSRWRIQNFQKTTLGDGACATWVSIQSGRAAGADCQPNFLLDFIQFFMNV
eukprot:SAG31_NODE_2129_length_6388_cov_3.199396_3_plen_189_part_00